MPKRKEHIFIDGIEYKECSRCKELKRLDEYRKDNSKWDGLHGFCKECNTKIDHNTYAKTQSVNTKKY